LQPGGFDVTGHILASQVALPGRGVYWYGAMYGWGCGCWVWVSGLYHKYGVDYTGKVLAKPPRLRLPLAGEGD